MSHFRLFSFVIVMEHRALQRSTGLPGPGTRSRGTQTERSFPMRAMSRRSVGVQAIVGHVLGEVPSPALSAAQWSVEHGHLLIPQVPPIPPHVYPPVPSPHPPAALGRAPRDESQMDPPVLPGPSPLMHLMNMERRLDHSQ